MTPPIQVGALPARDHPGIETRAIPNILSGAARRPRSTGSDASSAIASLADTIPRTWNSSPGSASNLSDAPRSATLAGTRRLTGMPKQSFGRFSVVQPVPTKANGYSTEAGIAVKPMPSVATWDILVTN